MLRLTLLPLAWAVVSASASAQTSPADQCARPDTIAIRGNSRVSATTIKSDAGIAPGQQLNYRMTQRVIKDLYATGQFSNVALSCEAQGTPTAYTLVITVAERPLLGEVTVNGAKQIAPRAVKDKIDILIGRPIDPAQVAKIAQRIDSLYESEGYYLARVRPETSVVNGRTKLAFEIEEGHRLAVSGIVVEGNKHLSAREIVKAMKTKPEGFWWWRKGEFDEDKFAADVGERVPKLYSEKGYIDFQVLRDTLIVDREKGKGLVRLEVLEGKRYRVGTFEALGNRRFSADEIHAFYPFVDEDPTLTQRITGVLKRSSLPTKGVFDEARWNDATQKLHEAYYNEGYIYSSIRPVEERTVGPDSLPVVNLRWEIDEGQPAIINRVDILGNDYTTEACLRDMLVVVPGDVFNEDRLVRSWQQLQNLGFFEAPMTPPETRRANDNGDVDLLFHVKEKRTGNFNFGASVGQGTGLGGFIGVQQPNLFGQCKNVAVNWQFGKYINDFQISYTDPSIRQSRISGTVSAYHTADRYTVGNLGRLLRTGGQIQFGFPIRGSNLTRLYLSYGLEDEKQEGGVATLDSLLFSGYNLRSTVGATVTHDSRIGLPFAVAGGIQTITAQFNGGPLGGTASFQRYTAEARTYAPLGSLGGGKPGSQPAQFVFGLTGRAGAVFGNTGPFFTSQKFALGGTQYGEMLRGYDEFSITPNGYVGGTNNSFAQSNSFGSAYFTTTAELGLRINSQVYTDIFYDAGNIWNRPREFNPSRLFRGAGIGVAVVTPLGPLGLDWAYGFDRTKIGPLGSEIPDPQWTLHFKLGNIF